MTGSGGAASGGAFWMDRIAITRSRVAQNVAQGGNGASGGNARGGGATLSNHTTAEDTGLFDVTFDGNLAAGGMGTTGSAGTAEGGGLLAVHDFPFLGVTFSDNEARGGESTEGGADGVAQGGGAFLEQGATMSHGTVVGNRVIGSDVPDPSGSTGGGGLKFSLESTLDNLILGGNTVDVGGGPVANDCEVVTTATSLGHNLVQSPGTCTFAATGDQTGVDPALAPLADLGCADPLPDGSCLPVHAVTLLSLALDGGSCILSGETRDARGFARPFDHAGASDSADGCDAGAHELIDTDGNGIDDAVDFLFADGFESGTMSAWSISVP